MNLGICFVTFTALWTVLKGSRDVLECVYIGIIKVKSASS